MTTIPPLDGWRTLSCDEDVVIEIIDVFGCATGGRNAFDDCITAVAAAESSIKDVLVVMMMVLLWSVFLQWIASMRGLHNMGDVFRHDAFQTSLNEC